MIKSLTWRKKIYSSSYSFFSNGIPVGFLNENIWGQKSTGVIDGKYYSITTKGLFTQNVNVVDAATGKLEASIMFNLWKTKAQIIMGDGVYSWQYSNAWNTKWKMVGWNGAHLWFQGSSQRGVAESNSDNSLLLLLGIYTYNAFRTRSMVTILIVFIPIWIAVLN